MNKLVTTTNGYKTKTAALLYLLATTFGNKVPFINENKEVVIQILDLLIMSGLLHDLWRNRKNIKEWIISKYTLVKLKLTLKN